MNPGLRDYLRRCTPAPVDQPVLDDLRREMADAVPEILENIREREELAAEIRMTPSHLEPFRSAETLIELEAEFLGKPGVDEDGHERFQNKVSFSEAAGVWFLCPVCFEENRGPVGTHAIICWGPEVSQEFEPKPGRWKMNGTGLEDLTLTGAPGKSDSVLLNGEGGCKAHFHVRGGKIV